MIWLINLAALLLIAFIVWWFWIARPAPARRTDGGEEPISVIVEDGTYTPARIEVTRGRPVTLRFLRRDPSPCAAYVVFDDLGVQKELPVDEPVDLTLTPKEEGEFEFTCQMGMYRGSLHVVSPGEAS